MNPLHRRDAEAFTTLDRSEIRELAHPQGAPVAAQSLPEARVFPGQVTVLHRHHRTEELYHILEGAGLMTLGKEQFPVSPGETVIIPPGTPHCIENPGPQVLRFLCCCAPAYSDDDTELLNA